MRSVGESIYRMHLEEIGTWEVVDCMDDLENFGVCVLYKYEANTLPDVDQSGN